MLIGILAMLKNASVRLAIPEDVLNRIPPDALRSLAYF